MPQRSWDTHGWLEPHPFPALAAQLLVPPHPPEELGRVSAAAESK